jgi:TorA maturation chaperone TorD
VHGNHRFSEDIDLKFMANLLAQAVAAEEGQAEPLLENAQAFLDDFLLHWLPDFGELVARTAQLPFYRTLGNLLTAFTAVEGGQPSPNGKSL